MLLAAPAFSVGAAGTMELELPTLDGQRFFRLSDEQGRLVVVNFWDTECPPCVHEMPLLDKIARSHPDAIFVGVTVSDRNRAQNFLEEHAVGYLQLLGPHDPKGVLRRFGDPSTALPHTAIVRRDHSLCATHTGEVSLDWVNAALSRCRSD